jgi:TRAP transporter TAXI family solute receptor
MSKRVSTAVIEFLKVWGVLTLVVAAGFVITYQYVGAPPPKVVRIATGGKNGAYFSFAERYARLLAADGIALEVVSTAGSVENFALLKKGDVSLALVQGGSATQEDKESLQSLGSLFVEPIWIFTRARQPVKEFSALKGKRLAVGSEGSGTYLLATQLLSAAGIDESNTTLIRADSARSVAELSRGSVDAAFFVASASAPLIREIQARREFQLVDFDRAAAYVRWFPFLTAVTLAEGVLDLRGNLPPRDITLVAVSANLAARRDLNTGLIPALLNTVAQVHQPGGLLERRRQFPSVDFVDLPLNQDAARYIVNGPSFLYRWLPYSWAVLLDRLKIMIVPFLALMIPLFRIAPPLYNWRIRSKIYRWYGAVREIDAIVQKNESVDPDALLPRLIELEREVASISVPLSYTGELYNLRLHIDLLQQELERRKLGQETKGRGAA